MKGKFNPFGRFNVFYLVSSLIYLIAVVEAFFGFEFIGMVIHNLQKWLIVVLGSLVVLGFMWGKRGGKVG